MAEPAPGAKVTLRKVTQKTVRNICDLSVAEGQRKFVAPNAVSMAEAQFHKGAWFRAIYACDTPVGFVQLLINQKTGRYHLWRFMVDAKHQGKGHGAKALRLVIEHVRKMPRAKAITLCVVRAEGGAEKLYQSFGFKFTGKIEDGENVMRLDLKRQPKVPALKTD